MINWIKAWLRKEFTDKFTVAYDRSPFWRPGFNEREELERKKGLFFARHFARCWVAKHPMGQARIIKGWHYWPEENKIDIDGLDPMNGTAGYTDSR